MRLGKLLRTLDRSKLPGKLFFHGLSGDYWIGANGEIAFTDTRGEREDRMFTLDDFQRDDWVVTFR
ncbi:hypothetical protein EV128_12578 [Rhizobium azibense]|nr:hypothetical protein EV128_12578 [Rhizobium azibense]